MIHEKIILGDQKTLDLPIYLCVLVRKAFWGQNELEKSLKSKTEQQTNIRVG